MRAARSGFRCPFFTGCHGRGQCGLQLARGVTWRDRGRIERCGDVARETHGPGVASGIVIERDRGRVRGRHPTAGPTRGVGSASDVGRLREPARTDTQRGEMKKLALIPLVILVLGVFALPAYATHYAALSVSCTAGVRVGWTAFPGPPTRSSPSTSRNPVARRGHDGADERRRFRHVLACHCRCQGTDSSR